MVSGAGPALVMVLHYCDAGCASSTPRRTAIRPTVREADRVTTTALRALLGSVITLGVLSGCADAPVTGPGAVPPDPAASSPVVAPPPAPAAPAPVPDAATAARIDADFARMMIPHHEQALLLSSLATGRAAAPDVATLAFRIDRAQVEEVGQLRGFLRLRGEPIDGARMTGMGGMAAPATIDRLRAARGPQFDRLWLETMIAHHEGALAMSRDHLAATGGTGPRGTGSVSALAEFSRTTLLTQQAEIDRMRALTRG